MSEYSGYEQLMSHCNFDHNETNIERKKIDIKPSGRSVLQEELLPFVYSTVMKSSPLSRYDNNRVESLLPFEKSKLYRQIE